MKKWLFAGLSLAFSMTANAGVIYDYSFSVDGSAFTDITPYSGTQSAQQYYNYYTSAGHPAFGTEKNTAFFWLWNETDTNALSLNVIFNSPGAGGTGGNAFFTLSGMPGGWSWLVQDDNADIGTVTDTSPTWNWLNNYTDGGSMGGLENSLWDIAWNLTSVSGIDNWYFLSADDTKYEHPFIMGAQSQLVVRSALANTSHVPEPSSLLLLGAGLLGVGLRQRKR